MKRLLGIQVFIRDTVTSRDSSNLPTLISNPFNLSPQQSPLLSMYTSETGSHCSKLTLHQGFIVPLPLRSVRVHLEKCVSFTPSTA